MAEIFISYSREDREWVERLASQLQSEGFSVWWDWDLLVGRRYRETIDNELQTCKAAVVVWSQHSVQSDFVRDEAEEAQQRNILVPVLKETVRPPAGFRQIQTADLTTWSGGGTHAEFRRVMKGISNMVGKPAAGEAVAATFSAIPAAPQSGSSRPAASVDTANLVKAPSIPSVKPMGPIKSMPNPSALLARLPPVSHRVWRYAAFAVVALIGVLLIVSRFPSTSSVPAPPASVINGAPTPATPVTPATSADGGDIGQTGPHPAAAPTGGGHTGNDNGDTGNAAGDSGDIGQGGTH
jgi:hypothetical protein